jgi:tetratricopeptide (TPR) repeat protein
VRTDLIRRIVLACALFLVCAPALADDGARLVVLPFRNETGEPSLYWIGEAFAIGLTDHLLAAGIDTVESERRRGALVEIGLGNDEPISMASAILLARRVNASLALLGEVRLATGHRLEVSGYLIDVKSRELDEPVTLTGEVNDLHALQNRFARAVLPQGRKRGGHEHISPLEALKEVPLSSFELFVKAMSTSEPDLRREFLDGALEADPLYTEALVERARLEIDEGRPQDAFVWLDRVQVDQMSFPERLWMVRGDAVAATGDNGSAADLYQKALKARPLPAAHFRLAAVLARQGQLVEARREVEAGLTIDPNHPEGIELREALARQGSVS